MTIDNSTITGLTGLVVAITAPVILWMQLKQKKEVAEVKSIAKETHILVNSNMGTQLLVASTLAQRVADLTANPEDRQVATDTRKKYDDHMTKQAVVDNAVKPGQ